MAKYSLVFLSLSLLLLFVCSLSNGASPLSGFRASMVHVNPTLNLTSNANLNKLRSYFMGNSHSDVRRGIKVPFKVGDGYYVMQLSIGSPPHIFSVEIDTGSNLIWTQCEPCKFCFKQPDPLYDPLKSTSFSKLSCASPFCNPSYSDDSAKCEKNTCVYDYEYDNGDYTKGYLASETFKIGDTTMPDITFGCGTKNDGDYGKSSGIVGLGGGKLSLISQLDLGKFSYCLQSDTTKTNPILFGSFATLKGGKAQSIPLVKNTEYSLYYVNLIGITVGTKYIPVQNSPIGLKTKEVLIDSGTTYTLLITPILKQVKRAFIDQVKLPVFSQQESEELGLDLCFITNKPSFSLLPTMILHFEGGAKMVLPKYNYFMFDPDIKRLCMLIVRDNDENIIGNIMQMDMQILYDLDNVKLYFEPANCDNI